MGQLLLVHFNGELANEDARVLIQQVHVGGIIYYAWSNGLTSPQQVHELSLGLQNLVQQNRCSIPLIVAVDQEGGLVARLSKGFTFFPGNKALGMTEEPMLADLSAFAIGQELRAVGINMNLAPVVDINSNPRNPVIGIRSFGDNPQLVISFAGNALQGYRRAGIITSIKHFPGHGDVGVDSHEDLPVIKKSKEELQKNEILPFALLAGESDTIMTAHIMVPALDPINCATLSKSILNLLRNEVGFNGVIITDSLVMEGLLKNCLSIDDAAIRALEAGCDMLMLGGKQLSGSHANLELTVADIQRIHCSLVEAVRGGRISEGRVNEAVQRILNLKNQYSNSISCDSKGFDSAQHQVLSKTIASRAIKTIGNNPLPSESLNDHNFALFSPDIVQESIKATTLCHLVKENRSLYFNGLNPTETDAENALEIAKESDILIFCSYNAWKNPGQAATIQALIDLKKPMILIVLRDSIDATLFPAADLIIQTFSPTVPSIQAASDFLTKISLSENRFE